MNVETIMLVRWWRKREREPDGASMKARSSSHDVAADGVISSKKNSQVKVKKKKKWRESILVFSLLWQAALGPVSGLWTCRYMYLIFLFTPSAPEYWGHGQLSRIPHIFWKWLLVFFFFVSIHSAVVECGCCQGINAYCRRPWETTGLWPPQI